MHTAQPLLWRCIRTGLKKWMVGLLWVRPHKRRTLLSVNYRPTKQGNALSLSQCFDLQSTEILLIDEAVSLYQSRMGGVENFWQSVKLPSTVCETPKIGPQRLRIPHSRTSKSRRHTAPVCRALQILVRHSRSVGKGCHE